VVVWRAYTRVIHCVFDQLSNLQNCPRGPQTDTVNTCRKVTLPVNFKKSRHLGFGVFIVLWSMVGRNVNSPISPISRPAIQPPHPSSAELSVFVRRIDIYSKYAD
jgi:hypothetical protein